MDEPPTVRAYMLLAARALHRRVNAALVHCHSLQHSGIWCQRNGNLAAGLDGNGITWAAEPEIYVILPQGLIMPLHGVNDLCQLGIVNGVPSKRVMKCSIVSAMGNTPGRAQSAWKYAVSASICFEDLPMGPPIPVKQRR